MIDNLTIVAARALHHDEAVGAIEVDKLADLALLDRDPLSIPLADLANVKVKETVVGGRTVYRADR